MEGECEIDRLRVVRGAVPRDLSGVFLRNGPNPAREPLLGVDRYHWFDGDGMIHWIRILPEREEGEGEEGEGDGGEKEVDDNADSAKEASSSSSESSSSTTTSSSNLNTPPSPPSLCSYGRRYVRTRGFEQESAANRSLFTGLRDINPIWRVLLPRLFEKVVNWATRGPDSPFWVIQSKNTANNGVKHHAGRLLATYESGSAYELELGRELRTKGLCDFSGTFGAADYWLDNMTAHAKTCAETGEMVYIGYNLIDTDGDGKSDVTVGVVDGASGARTRRGVVRAERPSMQHDVGITRSRVVLLDGPLVFDLDRVMSGGLPFAFENDLSMRLGIVRRRDIPATRTRTRTRKRSPSGEREKPPSDDPVEVAWVDTGEPCFAYHVVNCYDDPEDPDVVVIDACKADGTNALGMARGFDAGAKNGYADRAERSEPSDSDDPRDSARSRQPPLGSHPNAVGLGRDVAAMWRWRVNARTGTLLSSARLSGEHACDFPAVSPAVVGQPHAFAYAAGYAAGAAPVGRMDIPGFDKVHKFDLRSGKTWTHELGENVRCGDVCFAPASTAASGKAAKEAGKGGGGGTFLAPGEEADGYVLALTHEVDPADGSSARAELVVLAAECRETGEGLREVCAIEVPVRVPFGFHAEFVDESELGGKGW